MNRRQDGPTPVIKVHFTGNPPAEPRRRPPVRRRRTEGEVRPPGPQLVLLHGEGIRVPAKVNYIAPMRTYAKHNGWDAPIDQGLVDLPDPSVPQSHLEAAIDLLRRAAQASTVCERGDATLLAVEHASRSFGEMFDREAAKKLLRDIADSL
jgi:hypothetical protein